MFKFVTIYRKVDDMEALERFFSDRHLPLAEQLPGLLASEVSRIKSKPGGQSRFHLMYELYFADEASFRAALLTTAGVRLFEALLPWAENKILTWFDAESWAEEMAD